MAHNLSWIDPEELRDLVEQTAYRPPAPSQAAPPPPRQARYPIAPDSASQQAARQDDAPQPRARPVSHSVTVAPRPQPRASAASPDPSPPTDDGRPPASRPVPPPPTFGGRQPTFSVPANMGIEQRLAELLRWSCETAEVDTAFLADADGLLIAQRGGNDNVENEAARAVMFASVHATRAMSVEDSGYLALDSGGRCMVIVWGRTRHGQAFLGMRGVSVPPSAVLNRLPHALREALR